MKNLELIQKAIWLTKNGNITEAEKIYKNLLKSNQEDEILLSVVGLFYTEINDYDKAISYLKKANDIKETLGTLSALGFAEFKKADFPKASYYLEKSLNFGGNPEIYYKLIISLYEMQNLKKAIEYSDKIFELYTDNVYSVWAKVKSLMQTGKLIDAEKLCVNYLKEHESNNETVILWSELGLLKELIYSDDKQALECYKIVFKLVGSANAKYDIGVCYEKLGELDKAEKIYRSIVSEDINNEDFSLALGMCLLKQKKFIEGYKYFNTRTSQNTIKKNIWQKGDAINNNLVIVSEGGYGDNIHFIRYLPFFKDKKPVVIVPKALLKLLKNSYPNFEFIVYNDFITCDKYNKEDKIMRMMDLPYALDMDFNHIPYSNGYLKAKALGIKNSKLKVGLCWEANAAGVRSLINRTIHIKCFEPFFDLENVEFYSFQYDDTFGGNTKYPQMINLAKDFNDFYDTASALKSMDLIISVDTAVAHLAGALGVKTYLLLPYFTDWRWFSDNKTTPWYKSIEIFKQQDSISWELPFKEIYSRLKDESI